MAQALNDTLDVTLGFQLVELLSRNDILEIYCNDDGYIWYQSTDEGKIRTDIYLPPENVTAIIRLAAGQVNKVVTDETPSISTEIAGYGYRFQGELPPIVHKPQFNIRKKATKIFSLASYVQAGSLSEGHKNYIQEMIALRKNILIAGGTGTGKTTFLNAVLEAISTISPTHRIISLEDLPELQCPALDYSPMFTKQCTGQERIKYDMTQLLSDCMRRSPDRIIVGEVRDCAAYTMLKAWNTGHPGGACTVHANSAESALDRVRDLALEANAPLSSLMPLIGEAIDVVVSIVHVVLPNGVKTRRIEQIISVHGYDTKTATYKTKEIPKNYKKESSK